MSLHGIAGPKSRNSENKCPLARPIMVPNFVTLRKEMCEISAVKIENFCSQKSGPNFTKIAHDLLRTNACHRAKFYGARPNGLQEKRYKFFTPFTILAPQGQSSPAWVIMYSKVLSINLPKLVPF